MVYTHCLLPIVSSEKINEDARHDVRIVKDKYVEDAKEVSVIQNASSGLALQGVLVTRKLNDLLRRRNVVLKPPDDIQLSGRSIDQQNKTWYFTSEKNEGDMTVLVNMLGYSVAKLAKVRKDDIRLELCEGLISISEDENVEDSIKKKTYCSTVKYFILPIKSFSFSHHQLCLSSDALLYIKELDKKYSSGEQVECKEFLCKFGSHVYTGPLHLGGKYTFKSCESGFNVSKRSNVQKVQGEVITMQEKSNSTSAINSTVEIFLTGPLVAGAGGDLSEWVHLLEASKSAWSLIDRGTEIVPVWDILKAKHASDFDNSSVLVDKMKLAWEAMNKQSSIVDKKDEVVNKREHVTEIHIPTTDHRKGEKQVGATCGEDAEKTKVTEYVPTTIFQDASSGLALQGVLVSRKLNDLTSRRDAVLQPPDDVQLMGPSIDQQSKSWYFTSERHEERVTAIVDTLGYSVAELAKVGERGVSLEICGAFKSVYEEEKRGTSILQENNFNSTVKYSFLPVKSFSFSDQLCLSSDALAHLKEIDEKYTCSSSEEEIHVTAQCTDFLRKFGSHVYTGPLHFGGKYRLRSSSSGFKESERRDVQKLQGEVIANQEHSGSTTAPVMISTMDGDFYRKYSDALISQTSLKVNLTGGPLVVRDYSEWVRGLEMSNSTWSLIDRGTERVPVWDVFKRKHANDFHNSSALVDIMKQAWEAMNKKSSIVDENTGKGEEQTEAIHSESAPTASAAEERNVTEKYKYVPVPKEEQTGARDSESAKKTNVTEKYVPTSVPQYLMKEKVQTGARDGEDAAKTKVTEYTLRKPWEKKPLRKGDEDDLPEDSIDAELSGVGLEPSYWSGVFEKQLGIKTPQSLQYVGDESYQLLLQFLRKPWEKKPLRKLLKMESEEAAYKENREKQKEKLKKRQEESAEFLKTLKDLEKEGKDRHDKGVQEMEQCFRERLQIPESVWLREDATLSQAIEKMESMHGNISGTLKVCMDFISMHKYFQLALESMHGGVYDKRMDPGSVIQPDLSIKATATVAKAVFCVRSYLHKAGQKYEDCFLTTMLYPLRYDPENNIFLVLLTRNELKYLCEEFEEESKGFFTLRRRSLFRACSHICFYWQLSSMMSLT